MTLPSNITNYTVIYCKSTVIQLLYMAVFDSETGKALLLLRCTCQGEQIRSNIPASNQGLTCFNSFCRL